MQQQVAILEPTKEATELSQAGPDSRLAARFVYSSGSQPLEGYTIKRGVGQGGFGEIYYAVSDAGKEVALKLIRRNLEVELRGIRQCLNLRHPNLLDLYDIRVDAQGDTWVVMEYVAGDSLDRALESYPNGMPVPMALCWLGGIAAGVTYLHDRGIVHRDLKPGNIFSSESMVKVGDYGLSKFVSCSRRSGHTESIGTVHYMAPEVANGRYGKQIDIYAMGVILYEMLTGRVPFEGESVGEVLMKHLTAKPDLSRLHEPYRGVIARALEKDPANRWQTAADMIAALPMPASPVFGQLPPAALASAVSRAGDHEAITAEVVEEEPIWRELSRVWRKISTAWNQSNLNTPIKVLLLIAAVVAVLHSAPVVVPLAVMFCIFYGVYRLVWTLTRTNRNGLSPASRAMPTPVPPNPPAVPQGIVRAQVVPPPLRSRREGAIAALFRKSPRERLTELLGSMLAGAAVTIVTCVVAALLVSFDAAMPRPEQCAWMLLTSLAGTWAVLTASKFWERSRGDMVLRRFTMMVLGLALGAAAFGIARMFLVALPAEAGFPEPSYSLPASFFATDGNPQFKAFLAAFGTLFLLMRWWRQADPLRSTRLSLWTLLVTMVVAGAVASAWHFPQPWLPLTAGAISVAVQLASPWIDLRNKA